jgi:hypothetical protein
MRSPPCIEVVCLVAPLHFLYAMITRLLDNVNFLFLFSLHLHSALFSVSYFMFYIVLFHFLSHIYLNLCNKVTVKLADGTALGSVEQRRGFVCCNRALEVRDHEERLM